MDLDKRIPYFADEELDELDREYMGQIREAERRLLEELDDFDMGRHRAQSLFRGRKIA